MLNTIYNSNRLFWASGHFHSIYIHAFIRGTHVCYSLKAHALGRGSSLEKLKEPLFVMFPSVQLQWGMRSRSVTRPHYERHETALITERKWPKQWTKPRINVIWCNYFIHFLFRWQNKSFYTRSDTEEREENKLRGVEEWVSIPLPPYNQNTLQLTSLHFLTPVLIYGKRESS